jgi:Cu/Ag efflux protein CusF
MRRLFLACAAALVAAAVWAQAPQTSGQIMKVDKAAGRVTLKHGEIKNLDMPPMTMVFRVRDAAMLDGVAVGDQVRFTAERVDGQYTVTALAKAR